MVPHSCKLFSCIAYELKQPIICVNHGKHIVKLAPKNCAWDIIIDVQHFFLRLPLPGNIYAY